VTGLKNTRVGNSLKDLYMFSGYALIRFTCIYISFSSPPLFLMSHHLWFFIEINLRLYALQGFHLCNEAKSAMILADVLEEI
jgi:hypothetical protein